MEIYVAEIPPGAGFTGKELDAETGLYHLGARSYDPWSGRFLETDPLGDLSFGESPYSYSHDNPVEFSDPSGEYSYEINGVPVSNQVGQSFMSSADIGQYELGQQHQAYEQWQSIANWQPDFAATISPMMSLATPDMSSPVSLTLGTVAVSEISIMAATNISAMGINFIKSWESLRLHVYNDIYVNPTIGWGHELLPGENYQTISLATADILLRHDIQIAVNAVDRMIHVPLTQNEFDALTSFTFNAGAGGFLKSGLPRSLNNWNFDDVRALMMGYGTASEGLYNRRNAEVNLFLYGIY